MGEGHKKLNFSDCMGLAIGQIIGSGIMVLTGIVIGLTGHGIAAAFILGAVLAVITCVPFIILTSAIPSSGAGFTYIRRLLGEKAGFMYIAMFVLSQVLIATYAKGFASYFCSIFPQFGESAVAMAALVICTAINLIGLKSSALVQKGMVVLLLLSLFLFIVFGLPKVSWDALTPTVSNLMPNGPKNFFTGVALLSFACGGAKFVAENGDDIVEPSRTIPKVIVLSTSIVAVFYVLIGIVAGYIIAAIMGLVLPTTAVNADGVEYTKAWVLNWDKVANAAWFSVPKLMPVKLVFDWRAIIPVLIMFVVTAVETVGDISGVMEGGMGREATDKELSGGVICDGIGSSLAALFGVLPNTSFSQNVGLVTMTKIVNRMALASGAVFLILCGLFPKLAALISIMPQSVLGGAAVMMFSSIVISGIQLITKEPMTMRNITIVSVALGLGYGIGSSSGILAHLPQGIQLIFGGIVPAAIVAIIFNIILPKDAE